MKAERGELRGGALSQPCHGLQGGGERGTSPWGPLRAIPVDWRMRAGGRQARLQSQSVPASAHWAFLLGFTWITTSLRGRRY